MKLLRNPLVTGAVAVLAMLLFGYNVVLPQWRRAHPVHIAPVPTPSAPTPAAPARVAVPGADVPSAGLLQDGVNVSYAEGHFATWAEVPKRDPFLLVPADPRVAAKGGAGTNSPLPHLKLKGIWEQTGACLAVINRGVYATGDEIEGYQIISIEHSEVWFQGAAGKERLGFEKPRPDVIPVTTNHPPGATSGLKPTMGGPAPELPLPTPPAPLPRGQPAYQAAPPPDRNGTKSIPNP